MYSCTHCITKRIGNKNAFQFMMIYVCPCYLYEMCFVRKWKQKKFSSRHLFLLKHNSCKSQTCFCILNLTAFIPFQFDEDKDKLQIDTHRCNKHRILERILRLNDHPRVKEIEIESKADKHKILSQGRRKV